MPETKELASLNETKLKENKDDGCNEQSQIAADKWSKK